ncbi:5-dehydro-4-deoxyglucarate dehydratase [Rubripirellula lacrimiformis]|uniref:5-dehydro-4-deoxyglucarate dehydratase n=1 Tax=Rubripirellula lacrimiformis TaxID=1930273 RepID=A0A517NH14_9BACT|nr:dihydrodipicolinate synthase family protein [Rubripirellula lacrimiformis]QDT06427.1 5-dehydro-4-deoxyglucarate dehydratase [Rubripirellula lacrimiformis]
MNTEPFSADQLRTSVIAVPPLARDNDLKIDHAENTKIIRHIEAGGVRSLLYGGNAVLYHARLSEYASMLSMLADSAGDDTVVVPSVGPAYGLAMDQVDVLADFDFPTVMLLPSRDIVDQNGIATGVRHIAERLGKPIVLYLKFDRWLDPAIIKSLEADGVISWIKYAVVLDDPADDPYMKDVMQVFPADRMVSGIGEQPAVVHVHECGMRGFTSGCVCVAPKKSMDMMHAIHAGDLETAESIRQWFSPLEDLRNEINPIRVLHHAVEQAKIAKTGPMLPMLSDLTSDQIARIAAAVQSMK